MAAFSSIRVTKMEGTNLGIPEAEIKRRHARGMYLVFGFRSSTRSIHPQTSSIDPRFELSKSRRLLQRNVCVVWIWDPHLRFGTCLSKFPSLIGRQLRAHLQTSTWGHSNTTSNQHKNWKSSVIQFQVAVWSVHSHPE
jgi:hypothetical protein